MPEISNDRALLYYQRLAVLGTNKGISTTIDKLAELMFTSTRHSRTLLKQLDEKGWIDWQPKVGRNQRSILHLNHSESTLVVNVASEHISQGHYEKALQLLGGDKALFGQVLQQTAGPQVREGVVHIQLTYDRLLSPLDTTNSLRNSERFLTRQVFSCLTRCDGEGNVEPDLAHHWRYDSQALTWRFYLRPHLRFHDEAPIDAETIAELFMRLKQHPNYCSLLANVVTICAVGRLCIEFTLSQPEPSFAALLADYRFSVLPSAQLENNSVRIGSGPFKLVEHSQEQLDLQAFEHYHGLCALSDSVTIWQLPKAGTSSCSTSLVTHDLPTPYDAVCSHLVSTESGTEPSTQATPQSRIEDGCLLAMFNHTAALDSTQRHYLGQLMNSRSVLQLLSNNDAARVQGIAAYNLLPSWMKVLIPPAETSPLPKQLDIAIYQHHALRESAQVVADLLERVGVSCQINEYSHADFYELCARHKLEEEIILTSMSLDDNRPSSAFIWLATDRVLRQCLTPSTEQWLQHELEQVKQQNQSTEYMTALEPIASTLVSDRWIIPLFHHKQTLNFADQLQGVSMTIWGWPDIKSVWVEE
ncbi:SgrR family transcriptional regulator [Vibrio sp. ER1A]|uniref:SgrR family transcriptional regulator n=1 Tax=Vibrio sp. ER1A TaxID=1517681 RepID=UPI0004DD1984|nr:SgrR family transcriptional regulator [Vibrio sp. ER1A]KFA98562.1 hypothetical protein HW45_14645 [Vibrio sp. ER1A]